MKQIIKSIKSDAKKLRVLLEAIAKVWPSDEMIIWLTMLQNLAFDGSDTAGYDEKAEYEKMKDINKAFRAFKEYNNYHVISFIVSEIDMMFTTANMAEFDREEAEMLMGSQIEE